MSKDGTIERVDSELYVVVRVVAEEGLCLYVGRYDENSVSLLFSLVVVHVSSLKALASTVGLVGRIHS